MQWFIQKYFSMNRYACNCYMSIYGRLVSQSQTETNNYKQLWIVKNVYLKLYEIVTPFNKIISQINYIYNVCFKHH